jgi:two-component system CheB/CheR fusion protein
LLHEEGGADEAIRQGMLHALHSHGHWSGEIVNRRASGELFHEHLSLTSVHDAAGQIVNYIGIFTDISQIKAQQEKLERLANIERSLPARSTPTGKLP